MVLQLRNAIPFQVKYLITEPAGQVLSGIMTAPHPVDPKGEELVRFAPQTLKPLTRGNEVYVLAGEVGHVTTDERPVPDFHTFEVQYRFSGDVCHENGRRDPPPH